MASTAGRGGMADKTAEDPRLIAGLAMLPGEADKGPMHAAWRGDIPRALGRTGALILIYLALEWVSNLHEMGGLPVTAWNPGLGLLFAAIIHHPVAGTIALASGVALARTLVLESMLSPATTVLFGLLSALSYLLPALLARRFEFDPTLPRLSDLIVLFAAAAAGAFLNALLLGGFLILHLGQSPQDVGAAAMVLLIGDGIGIAVVTPLVLRVRAVSWKRPSWTSGATATVLVPLLLVMALLAGLEMARGRAAALGSLEILILPVVISALRLGLNGACVTLALIQLALIGLLQLLEVGPAAFVNTQAEMLLLTMTGLLIGAVVTERDAAMSVARQAQARVADMEQVAVRADRLTLASAMTSALSHEINQPMTAARALARAAAMRIERDSQPDLARLADNMRGVVENIDRATDILSRMRAFISRGAPERDDITVGRIVTDTLALIAPRAERAGIIIETDIPADLPPLSCDPVQIQQVLLNLIGNALDAHARQGNQVTDGRVVLSVVADEAARRMEFRLRDNGPGSRLIWQGASLRRSSPRARRGLAWGCRSAP